MAMQRGIRPLPVENWASTQCWKENIQRNGERVRVTAQLLRVADAAPLWGETFDEKFTDIFSVQDSISEKVC